MTPKTVVSEIRTATNLLLGLGIAVDYNTAIIRKGTGKEQRVTWANAPTSLLDVSIRGGFATIAEYRHLIVRRHYHCMLTDGSLLQLNYLFRGNDLSEHRLCFYPCPIEISTLEFQDIPQGEDFVSLFDSYLAREVDSLTDSLRTSLFTAQASMLRMRTPIRFDFNPTTQSEDHPVAHVHMQDNSCRWSLFGPLSVGHFLRFIFRHFYPMYWAKYPDLRALPMAFHSRSITISEEKDLFIECR